MMKEPDPTDDLDQTILETFDEMHAEAQVAPIFLTFPPRVIESIRAYAKGHSLEPGALIPFAIKALENRFVRLASGSSFDVRSARFHAEACLSLCRKSERKRDLGDDEQYRPADWWKTGE